MMKISPQRLTIGCRQPGKARCLILDVRQNMNDWPPLSDFSATVGRLATAEDTRANRAAFLLESNGVRIGAPIDMPLPCYAWFADHDTGDRQRCVIFQAEEVDGKRYFGGWLLDEKRQIVGCDSDFEIVVS